MLGRTFKAWRENTTARGGEGGIVRQPAAIDDARGVEDVAARGKSGTKTKRAAGGREIGGTRESMVAGTYLPSPEPERETKKAPGHGTALARDLSLEFKENRGVQVRPRLN